MSYGNSTAIIADQNTDANRLYHTSTGAFTSKQGVVNFGKTVMVACQSVNIELVSRMHAGIAQGSHWFVMHCHLQMGRA